MNLAELLHFCLTAKSTGQIQFRDGDRNGIIWLKDGDVRSAQIDGTEGEEAFFKMLLDKSGTCHFEEAEVDEPATIEKRTHFLLMEAARICDEQQDSSSKKEPRTNQFCLVFKTLNNAVFSLEEKTVIIGRDNKCDITVPDVSVSSKHCRILWNGQHHLIDDLESFNGTYLNEAPVEKATPLNDGDHIQVGLCHFRFEVLNEKHSPTDPKEAIPFTFGSETQKIELPAGQKASGASKPPADQFKSIQPTEDKKNKKSIWPFKS